MLGIYTGVPSRILLYSDKFKLHQNYLDKIHSVNDLKPSS